MPSKSAKYYASNPEARKKKAAYDTAYHKKPKAKKYRAELNKERRERGIYGKGGGDLAHSADGKTLTRMSASKNRANNRPNKKNSK
jgi:hypothetical protein